MMVMLVAMLAVHWGTASSRRRTGSSCPSLYLTGALALAFSGPGAYSLDLGLHVASLSDPVARGCSSPGRPAWPW